MEDYLFIIYIFILVGALEIIMGLPLMYSKIKPNWLYGFRTPKTVKNEEVWYKVNERTGRDFIISGIIVILVALSFMVFDFDLDIGTVTIIQAFILTILVLIVLFRGLSLIKKL